MAEESSSQEKTEDATPKRLREARKKGQVSKSKDMSTVIILIAGFALLAVMIPHFYESFKQMLVDTFPFTKMHTIDNEKVLLFLSNISLTFFKLMLPYLLGLSALAVAVGFFQIGPIFSAEPVKFQVKRLNIVENVKNMFKVTTFVELIKNIVKIVLIFYLAYLVIHKNLEQILSTVTAQLPITAALTGDVMTQFLIRVFVLFAIIAFLDVMVQRWQYKKQLRMTKEEVKREYKQDEGDPIIKSIRRQLHQEMAMGDTRKAVSASDVVITNPTELAIAVKYNEKEMNAPQIMAKGQRLFAEKIRDVAKEQGIPIVQNVPLAWSLIEIEVGEEIPETLYQAMAEVLIVIYRMKEKEKASV